MVSKILIVALGAFTLLANGIPTGGPSSSGRDTSQDYYLKSSTANASSPLNNLYMGLGDGDGISGQTAFVIAFLPSVGNATRAYMNGTHQAFDVGSAGIPGATYHLGSSIFQEPDPSVPSTAEIFEDGADQQDPIDVTLTNNGLLGYGGRKWLICDGHNISPTTPPTLEIPNSGPYFDDCEHTDLVKEAIAK